MDYKKILFVVINHDALFYCFKMVIVNVILCLLPLLGTSFVQAWEKVLWHTSWASPNVRDQVQS